MIRLIKMDLYRLFHAVSTYVMIAVVAGMAVLMSFVLKVDLDVMEKEPRQNTPENGTRTESEAPAESFMGGFISAGEGEPEEGVAFGITAQADENWLEGDIEAGGILMNVVQSQMLVAFIAIFVPLFVNAEQKKGYIKNIAGQIPRREMLALSKLPAVAVQVFLLFAVFSIANLTADVIFFRDRIVLGLTGAMLRALGMQYLLHVSWGCLIALLTMATRSTAFAMVTGIFFATGIFEMIIEYLNRAIHALIPSAEKFDILRYTLSYATENMTAQSTIRQIGGFTVIAVVYIALSAVAAGVVYRKRDVR